MQLWEFIVQVAVSNLSCDSHTDSFPSHCYVLSTCAQRCFRPASACWSLGHGAFLVFKNAFYIPCHLSSCNSTLSSWHLSQLAISIYWCDYGFIISMRVKIRSVFLSIASSVSAPCLSCRSLREYLLNLYLNKMEKQSS